MERASSKSSLWATPYPDQRAVSDSDLRRVTVDSQQQRSPQKSSIEISIVEEDKDLQDALERIAVMEEKESKTKAKALPSHSTLHVPIDQEEDGLDIQISDPIRMAEVQIHVPNISNEEFGRKTLQKPRKGTDKSKSKSKKSDKKVRSPDNVFDDEEASIGLPSRSESPSWDYYSDPLSFHTVDEDDSGPTNAPALPMACSFNLPSVHSSFNHWENRREAKPSPKYS